ncbi:uncharacterized protein LOC143298016 [Babylonia areolata]|uniref:uncharacterized protein LOC143298016 n=1 Tax=Babylonia areolata TaxID=304850 RepID=UPI003FD06C40
MTELPSILTTALNNITTAAVTELNASSSPSSSSSSSSPWNVTSVDQLLLERMGPRGKDTASAVLLTVVYVLIFLSGSLGNLCTCVVIVRNSCMQTTTNYYLFSLAMSDLLLLFFGLPPELFSIWSAYPWRFGEAFCYLRPTILELTSYASVLTITAFTVERYIAICRPLLSHKIAVLSRAVKIIVCIWVVSVLVALPYAVHTRLFYAVTWPSTGQPVADSLVCSIPDKWLEGRMTYMFQVSTFLFFLAPVTLIICLYILIGIAVRRSPLVARGVSANGQGQHVKHAPLPQQPRRVVIRMLVAVTVAFIICWAPFHTQRLMVLYVRHWTPYLLAAQSHIFYISGVLYFISCTVNPILYNVISRRYRMAFKRTIFGRCTQSSPAHGSGCPQSGLLLRPRSLQRSGVAASLPPPPRNDVLDPDSSPTRPLRGDPHCPPCRRLLVLRPDVTRGVTSQKSDVTKESVVTRAKRLTESVCPKLLLKLRKVRSDEKPAVQHEEEAEAEAEEEDAPGKDCKEELLPCGELEGSPGLRNGYTKLHVIYTERKDTAGQGVFPPEEVQTGSTCSSRCVDPSTTTCHHHHHHHHHLVKEADSEEGEGEEKKDHKCFISGNLDSNYNSKRDHSPNAGEEKRHVYNAEDKRFSSPSRRRLVVVKPLVKSKSLCRLCLSDSLGNNGHRAVFHNHSDTYPAAGCDTVMTS